MLLESKPNDPMLSIRRQPSISSSLTKCSLPRLAIGVGLLLVGLVLTPDRAQAQQQDRPSYWTQHIDKQVAELVESSDPALRAEGMQLLVKLSSSAKEMSVDFTATRYALYDVFFNRAYSDEQRILALSALHAISGDQMMQALADGVGEASSERIRRHLLLALEQHT